jgi:2,3-bisphosphoglycerate-dependent phosphoglycerate mutase
MNIENYYQKYGKERVDLAIEKLNYKQITTMPKEENPNFPILYIFRHGQSEDNQEMLFSGWRDSKITEKGKYQALELAKLLQNKKIDYLFSSTQSRAIETMKIAMSLNEKASKLEIHLDERLKERSYGVLQGKSKLELMLEDENLVHKYRRDYFTKAENGESLEEVVLRVNNFIKELLPIMKSKHINVAVSCHGNSIRGFRKYFENLTPEEVSKIETPLGADYISYNIK